MGLGDNLTKKSRETKLPDLVLRPEILLGANIPKPMHGLAPRVVLGNAWWDRTRRLVYASTAGHCIACGIHKRLAQFRQWIEAHELYETDYQRGKMVYKEAVPLCHCCHNYVHSGRLQAILDAGKITHAKYAAIIQHGDAVLAAAKLTKPPPYDGPCAAWGKWRLVIDGKEYKGLFRSEKEWVRYHQELNKRLDDE